MEYLKCFFTEPTPEEIHLLDLATMKAQQDLDAMVAMCRDTNRKINELLSRDLIPFKHACECLVRLMNLAQESIRHANHKNARWVEALEIDHEALLCELKDLDPDDTNRIRMINLTYRAWLEAILQRVRPASTVQTTMSLLLPGLSRLATSSP